MRQGQVTRLRNETKLSLQHPNIDEVQPHQAVGQPPPSSPNGAGSPKGRSAEEKDTILEDGKRQAEGKTGTAPQRKACALLRFRKGCNEFQTRVKAIAFSWLWPMGSNAPAGASITTVLSEPRA